MTDVKSLLGELQNSDPKFDEAQTVVDLVRISGDMLERMRERKGWSQAELADRLGLTTARVSQLESGTLRNAPSLKMMARLAHACGERVKLVASGEDAFGMQVAGNAAVDLSEILKELAALRGEVREVSSVLSERKTFYEDSEQESDVDLDLEPVLDIGVQPPPGFVKLSPSKVVVERIKAKKPGPAPKRRATEYLVRSDFSKPLKAED